MHKVVQKIKDSISEVVPDYESKRFLVAVSAGIDSMALLNACVKLGVNIEVAHCNFQLRGYESDSDQKFVEDYCTDLKINCFTKKFSVEEEKLKGESVQMTARRLRFSWFDRLIDQEGFDYLLLAHHLDDQIESFFINFMRGTGLKGLVGIRRLNGNRLRPMLELTKNDIEMYANFLEMEYQEDSSNHDYKYVRNKIRHHLIPLLKEMKPEVHEVFLRNNRRFFDAQLALDEGMDHYFGGIDKESVSMKQFLAAPDYYQLRFIEQYGFNSTQLKNLKEAGVGSVFDSLDHQLYVNRTSFEILEKNEPKTIRDQITELGDFHCADFSILMTIKEGQHIENTDRWKVGVDQSGIEFPITIRRWQTGDSFKPIGMGGRQKLSDFFINEKFDQREKQEQWLMVNGNGKIIWVIGKRLSDEFKIKSNSKSSLIFETKLSR